MRHPQTLMNPSQMCVWENWWSIYDLNVKKELLPISLKLYQMFVYTKQTEATQPPFSNCQLMGFRNCFVRGGLRVNNFPISWVKYIGRHLENKKCLTNLKNQFMELKTYHIHNIYYNYLKFV
jgi:hypothetical protein